MTTQTVDDLLCKINRESANFITITGSQILYKEITLRHDDAFRRTLRLRADLHHEQQRADEYRKELRTWHATENCSRFDIYCRNGQCGCSYHELALLQASLNRQRWLEKELAEQEHVAVSCRHLADTIIPSRLQANYNSRVFAEGYLEVLHITGDISESDWGFVVINSDSIHLSGPAYALHLTVTGGDQVYERLWVDRCLTD